MTYGSGANGCLGHGNFNDVTQAKIVEALLGYEVIQVSCGASHVLAVTNEHEVFAWGRGDNGNYTAVKISFYIRNYRWALSMTN